MELYAHHERRVFKYFNGVADVFGDPLAIYRRLLKHFDGDMATPLARAADQQAPNELLVQSLGALADGARAAFEMVPFDASTGAGATDQDCLTALRTWQDWMNEKKTPAAT